MTSEKKALIEIIGLTIIGFIVNILIYVTFSFLMWENLFEYPNFWHNERIFTTIGFIVGCVRGWLIINHRK